MNVLFLSSQLQLCIFLGWNMLLKQNGMHLEQMEFFHCGCTGGFPLLPLSHMFQLFNLQTCVGSGLQAIFFKPSDVEIWIWE